MKQFDDLVARLDDSQYFLDIFNERLKLIDSRAVKILFHQFFYIKRHAGADFFHYVIEHRLTLELKSGLKIRRKIYTISFSNNIRRPMYQVMSLVYKNSFSAGPVVVPKPLWYEETTMTLFYLGIPGDTLLEHLKNGHLDFDYFKKIAQALRRLHATKFPPGAFKIHDFSLGYLDPTSVLARPQNMEDPLKAELLEQLKKLEQLQAKTVKEKLVLSHGDFHPENVIVNRFNSAELAIIDLSEVCLAPRFYDLASFLLQLKLMSLGYLEPRVYAQIEKIILTSYFHQSKINPAALAQINLYKAWTALKNAVYSMIFIEEHNRHYARYLISLSREFSEKIK
ncbi:MAG TPA: phosphotransferase [bacterium]|nr:phosphotransferase [bacterium]